MSGVPQGGLHLMAALEFVAVLRETSPSHPRTIEAAWAVFETKCPVERVLADNPLNPPPIGRVRAFFAGVYEAAEASLALGMRGEA